MPAAGDRAAHDNPFPGWLTTKDVAELAGIDVKSIRRYLAHDVMPVPQRIGTTLIFKQSEIERWLAAGLPLDRSRKGRGSHGRSADARVTIVPYFDVSSVVDAGGAADRLPEFRRMASHKLLSFSEEQALGVRINQGRDARAALGVWRGHDTEARRALDQNVRDGRAAEAELFAHNMRLVVSIARKFARSQLPGCDIDDLIQEGAVALMRAAATWDYSFGFKFSTYGTPVIWHSMARALAAEGPCVRLPVNSLGALRRILRAEARAAARGETLTIKSVADECGLAEERVRRLLYWHELLMSPESLSEVAGDSCGCERAWEDETEHSIEVAVIVEEVDRAVCRLSAQQADVVRRRFGLDGLREQTLEEIGEVLGVTRERIRQVEIKALTRMGFVSNLKSLADG